MPQYRIPTYPHTVQYIPERFLVTTLRIMASFSRRRGVRHFRIDGIFHDIEYVCEALRLYQDVLKGVRDGRQTYQEYEKKYKEDHVSHGFYYTKTSKVK